MEHVKHPLMKFVDVMQSCVMSCKGTAGLWMSCAHTYTCPVSSPTPWQNYAAGAMQDCALTLRS
jgi:hypothetical protein